MTDWNPLEFLDRHDLSDKQHKRLRDRLAGCNAHELREILLWAAERHPDAVRFIEMQAPGENEPEIDEEQLAAEIDDITAPRAGAFGRPEGPGQDAMEARFKALARRGRDYDLAGHIEAARTIYTTVADALEQHRDLFNPHLGWHGELRETLRIRLAQLEE